MGCVMIEGNVNFDSEIATDEGQKPNIKTTIDRNKALADKQETKDNPHKERGDR